MSTTALAASLSGEIVSPDDPRYDALRAVHNGMIDKRPRLILRCLNTADVVDALRFARANDLEISVRGGGHNVAGTAVTQGGLMIDLSLMKAILVDPQARRGLCQPGATWGQFNRETQLQGLATTGGVISTTGVAGLTLGGGVGWLMSRYGLALDNLTRAELVTANGEVVTASASSNAELFWGLRGGGGNFGVVTAFEFALHPLGPRVYGGALVYPFDAARDVLRFFRDVTSAGLDDDFVLFATLQYAPDGSGERVAVLLACHCGSENAAASALSRLRGFRTPLADSVGPTSYCAQNAMLDAGFPRGARNYWRSSFVGELSDAAIDGMIEGFAASTSPMSALLIEHLHGAATRVAPTATAFPHRAQGYNFTGFAQWLDRAEDDAQIAWLRRTHDALAPFLARAAYSNYLTGDEGAARVRSAYGENFERLVQLKRRWDPDNVFHLNQNIPVGAGGSARGA